MRARFPYLVNHDGPVEDLEDVVGPGDVQDEENGEQEVEDVVGGKHLEQIVNEIFKQAKFKMNYN